MAPNRKQTAQTERIKACFQPGKRVHLVGIGGVSMRPLALVLRDRGMEITGSDMNASVSTDELRETPSTSATGLRISAGPTASSARPPPTTTILRSPRPEQPASRFLSGPRPGAF